MRINQELDPSSYTIRSVNAHEITVMSPAGNGVGFEERTLSNSFVIMPNRLISDWPARHVEELSEPLLTQLKELDPELLLLGTGSRLVFPQAHVMAEFSDLGIGLEVMDSAAACRTYNILMHEGRHVAAAILLP
ncbi:MAG: Mth938-like domain-containing protein [Gammaproteobacteria bacterium]|nr:Mth938-like domain-containing protein [Gammaproteobacteria bacterium]MDH5803353.1 Mth938-like domain-containing protein [Gammaproteobacteria bacterium]